MSKPGNCYRNSTVKEQKTLAENGRRRKGRARREEENIYRKKEEKTKMNKIARRRPTRVEGKELEKETKRKNRKKEPGKKNTRRK